MDINFDANIGCTYRWFNAPEVCMILERFGSVTFIGDETIQDIYAGFNILLREDFALGSLDTNSIGSTEQQACKCDAQFTNRTCRGFALKSSDESSKIVSSSSFPFCNSQCLLAIT
jgi:hypothetical protein